MIIDKDAVNVVQLQDRAESAGPGISILAGQHLETSAGGHGEVSRCSSFYAHRQNCWKGRTPARALVPEPELLEPEGGTEGPVVGVLEAIDVVRRFLSPRSVSDSELKGNKTEGRSLSSSWNCNGQNV